MSRNNVSWLIAAVLALVVYASARGPHWGSHHSTSVNVKDQEAWDDCQARYSVRFDDGDAYMGQEQQTLAPSSFSTLSVHGVEDMGVAVHGWDRPETQVTLCKAVPAGRQGQADAQLKRIALHIDHGAVTVEGLGPDNDQWVDLLLQVPRGVALDLQAHNGPIYLQDVVAGQAAVETENGPIDLQHCSGSIRVSAQNGPVELRRAGGNVKVVMQNGPLAVELGPEGWQGQGLEASTHNGPLQLRLPRNYHSGVEVEFSGYSPFECRDACDGAIRNWDSSSRSLRLGPADAPTVIHLSTVNGPVEVRSTAF